MAAWGLFIVQGVAGGSLFHFVGGLARDAIAATSAGRISKR